MSEYEEYPLLMTHPHYRPAVITTVPGDGGKPNHIGTSDKYPPVQVNNQDQEEQHAAMGYVRNGHGDPAAYAAAHANPPPENYVPQDFPKWVGGILCETVADEEAAILALVKPPEIEPRVPNYEGCEEEDEVAVLRAQVARMEALIAGLNKASNPTSGRSEKMKANWAKRKAQAAQASP